MKIVFVRNRYIPDVNDQISENIDAIQGLSAPLGMTYIAAVLREHGYQVSIIDAQALKLSPEQLKAKLEEENPDLVGLSVMSVTLHSALEGARIAKEVGAKVVFGGPHLSIYPQESVSYPFVDYGIIGEGEYTMLELVRALENDRPLREIKGLVYKEGGKIFSSQGQIIKDLDSLPFPARELLPMEKYTSINAIGRSATLISTRGCPFNCGFCTNPPFMRFHRVRNPKLVVDEIEELIKDYKAEYIMFYDDVITLRKDHIQGICQEIIRRGLKFLWESPTRLDCLDFELLKLMKRSGCYRLRLGVESGNEEILRLMKKRITLKQVEEAFVLVKKAGIKAFAYFIIGYAHETEETIKQTIEFAKRLNPDGAVFSTTVPYPGAHLYELAQKEGLVRGDYWKEYTLGLRKERIPYFVKNSDRWEKRAYREFYFRPCYFLPKLLEIRSPDTLRKYFKAAFNLVKDNLFISRKPYS